MLGVCVCKRAHKCLCEVHARPILVLRYPLAQLNKDVNYKKMYNLVNKDASVAVLLSYVANVCSRRGIRLLKF